MLPSVSVKYYRKTSFGLKPGGIDTANFQLQPERTEESLADYTTCALTAFFKQSVEMNLEIQL